MSTQENQEWYFYELDHDIYSKRDCFPAMSPEEEGTYTDACYYHLEHSMLVPNTVWRPFWPQDNRSLAARDKGSTDSIAVGQSRMLYEVTHEDVFKTIYYPYIIQANVSRSNWVFEDTTTPTPPEWSSVLDGFVNRIQPWSMGYRDRLTKAVNSEESYKDITLDLTVLAPGVSCLRAIIAPCLEKADAVVHLFISDSHERRSLLLRSLLLRDGMPCSSAKLVQFSWEQYKAKNKIQQSLLTMPPKPINTLCLVVHGIGQVLAENSIENNVIWAVGSMWSNMNKYLDELSDLDAQGAKDTQCLVLPINWRAVVAINSAYDLDDILPSRLKFLRRAVYEIVMDIPLYLSSKHNEILDISIREANRLYDAVVARQPSFAETGKVHIIAHSLGSMISADVLAAQPTDHTDSDRILHFSTENFISMGSPLALFWYLEGKQLTSRAQMERMQKDGENVSSLASLAVRNIYNFMHEVDFIATRMTPIVSGINAKKAPEPGLLSAQKPSHLPTQRTFTSPRRVLSLLGKRTKAFMVSQAGRPHMDQYSSLLEALNENGQIDWSISSSNPFNPLWEIFKAHTSYWNNTELARFIALEILRKPGVNSTAPEYRASFAVSSIGEEGEQQTKAKSLTACLAASLSKASASEFATEGVRSLSLPPTVRRSPLSRLWQPLHKSVKVRIGAAKGPF